MDWITTLSSSWYFPLLLFAAVVLFFHASEVLLVLIIEPEEFAVNSFLLSPAYVFAMCCGVVEFTVRTRWLQISTPFSTLIRYVGFALVVAGEMTRKAAWLTARRSFTHLIKYHRRPRHVLVTSGVYSWMRHPGYFGWLIWVIGTQLVLANAICTALFAGVAWKFFSIRIPIEEIHLLRMFGNEYRKYQTAVPTRIPGIL